MYFAHSIDIRFLIHGHGTHKNKQDKGQKNKYEQIDSKKYAYCLDEIERNQHAAKEKEIKKTALESKNLLFFLMRAPDFSFHVNLASRQVGRRKLLNGF